VFGVGVLGPRGVDDIVIGPDEAEGEGDDESEDEGEGEAGEDGGALELRGVEGVSIGCVVCVVCLLTAHSSVRGEVCS
jgi:hypothetical protein